MGHCEDDRSNSKQVDDIAKDWTWNTKFDLIHMRWLTGGFDPEQWDELYKQVYDNLEPGGWIGEFLVQILTG